MVILVSRRMAERGIKKVFCCAMISCTLFQPKLDRWQRHRRVPFSPDLLVFPLEAAADGVIGQSVLAVSIITRQFFLILFRVFLTT